ncbi:MAG TPA: N-6 DNA methylase [Saprospiraceae bacterium]|nr:N-6 DNA methylase [Saprospiraceae bacterium]
MKEKELKKRLQQTFDFSIWKEILPLFFKKVQYFTVPNKLEYGSEKVLDAIQLGVVQLDDDKRLAILVYEVDDTVFINRNRVELRKIAIKPIDEDKIHGALAFFYNKEQADYRFSFIAKESSLDLETGQLIKGETKPKRFTYLLGANEACTTAAKRMLVIIEKNAKGKVTIQELKDVFSVEALNKDFFKSYKSHFEKFWKYLSNEENPYRQNIIDSDKDTKDKQEKPIRDFCNKLLGRIVFLHFLQKKGWMGCSPKTKDWNDGDPRFMQQLFEDFSKPEHFQSQCLTHLFFETLNNKRPNDTFEVKGLNGKLSRSRVPYLNGGLFEPEKNKATLTIDFPADYFKELLEFFEQYNFTIDENSPDDHEVGIDPEMLGHIFENLLEDNRDKGAFYTPKEIVQYMCKESLIHYLLNTFKEQKDIEAFIRFHTVSPVLANKENAVLLNQKLDDIKVCDPAIGSGAFPIGMLQEIFEAKRFIFPFTGLLEFKNAEVKKNIIQNSIYGVDLEKGAVDIAQLRFWLALVVDEEYPHPLPNLDYKIMQGNSLLEQFGGIPLETLMKDEDSIVVTKTGQLSLGAELERTELQYTVFDKITRLQLWQLIEKYYDPQAWEQETGERIDKHAIKKEINDIVEGKIHFFVLRKKRKLQEEVDYWTKYLNINNTEYSRLNQKGKEFKKYIETKEKLEQLDKLELELIKLQGSEEKPFFLWHTWFKKDVFDKGGFDIMIGNPPYIQLQKMGKETDILQEAGFETFARTGDIYCLFYEKGIDLLKKGGTLTYITSNKWLRTDYGKNLRKFFSKQNPFLVIDLGANVFHSATVDTNILVLEKNSFSKKLRGISIQNHLDLKGSKVENALPIDIEEDNIWNVLSKQDYLIKATIENGNKILGNWPIAFNYGIKTGLTEAFLLTNKVKDELINIDEKNKEIIKPVLRGKDLDKYKIKFKDYYLINSHNGVRERNIAPIDINNYPTIKEYLESFGDKLKSRSDQGNTPFNLRNCAYLLEFSKSKIIYQEIVQQPSFAFDKEGQFFCLDTARIITGEKLMFLLAVLNSNLFFYSVKNFYGGGGLGNTGIRMKHTFIDKFPVPEIDNIQPFENIAEYLIYLNYPKQAPFLEKVSNEAVSQVFEDLVNMMVYELYFEEEMKSKEIDVLQFVTEKTFPDITQAEDKKAVIQKVYYELQQKDNAIRNRILIASSRSETLARINAATS